MAAPGRYRASWAPRRPGRCTCSTARSSARYCFHHHYHCCPRHYHHNHCHPHHHRHHQHCPSPARDACATWTTSCCLDAPNYPKHCCLNRKPFPPLTTRLGRKRPSASVSHCARDWLHDSTGGDDWPTPQVSCQTCFPPRHSWPTSCRWRMLRVTAIAA